MTTRSIIVCLSCLVAGLSAAAGPSKNDYASGIAIEAPGTQPMVEVTLSDDIYRTVTYPDLRDLRVFNADGIPVPHALCAAPQSGEPQVIEQSLPVFVLRGRDQVYTEGSRVNVETPAGTRVDVQEPSPPASEVVSGQIHIIDARETSPLRAIRFDWRSPDESSEVKVRIEGSDDLDKWRTVVPASTLLLAQQGDQELRRERIQVPLRQYAYLRVQRVDNGPPLVINSVTAEEVSAPEDIEPLWFTASRIESDEKDVLAFDAGHVAPVTYARVKLASENSTANVSLQSSSDGKLWRNRWTGESYLIVSETVRRESPPARFQATSDRYWHVQVLKDPDVYQDSTLELGYRPARLRFLAQGAGPFTVAFGSRRAEPTRPRACDALLADVSAADRERMIEQGYYTGQVVSLGGAPALKVPPKQTPLKVVVLWAVLVMGVALLVGMALSLLKRVRHPMN